MILQSDVARILIEVVPTIAVDLSTGTVAYANRAAEEIFGCPVLNGLEGTNVDALVPEHLRELHQAHRADYAAKPRLRPMGKGSMLQGRKLDGTLFPVQVCLVPTALDGHEYVTATIIDLTAVVSEGSNIHG